MVNWWFVYQCMCTSELCMTMCGCVGTGLLACCHAQLGSTGRCFRFAFRIPTVFDMFPIELVRFRYPVSSFSCSFPTFPNSISFSYWNVKVKTVLGLSRPSSTAFNPGSTRARWAVTHVRAHVQHDTVQHPAARTPASAVGPAWRMWGALAAICFLEPPLPAQSYTRARYLQSRHQRTYARHRHTIEILI